MYPGFIRNTHHDVIFRACHDLIEGREDRLILAVPPRHTKSTIMSEMFPAWWMGKHPTHQVICATYAQGLADDFGRKVRNHMQGEMYRAIFPDTILSKDSRSASKFATTTGGVLHFVGRGAGLTGRGAHLLLTDDLLKDEEEAQSETIRKKLQDWYASTAYTRLMPGEPGGVACNIQTRWHEDDLAGHLLREHADDGWKYLRMPAEAEDDDDICGRKRGEALWPGWCPLERPPGDKGISLKRFRRALGPRLYACLYQQRTVEEGGGKFKEKWLTDNYYKVDVDWKEMNRLILVDPATSKKKNSDYTAMHVLGLTKDKHVFELDMVRDRLNLRERKDALFRLIERYRPYFVGYEKYAAQADDEYILEKMDEENVRVPTFATLGGNKLAKADRIERLIPWFSDGRIHFPTSMWREMVDGAEYDMTELFMREEYGVYPVGTHDDMMDALSRLLDHDVPLRWPTSAVDGDGWDKYDASVRSQDTTDILLL
tara:strand:- start:504 stop:1961 length:1458 start_codon:yes stop_codon:yes gene_type:complete